MSQTLFADYPDHASAEAAVHRLEKVGYDHDDVSIITKDNRAEMASGEGAGAKLASGAAAGATTGGVVGGIAGLLAGAGVFPVLAGLLIGGPVAAALGLAGVAAATVSGVVTGAVAGGLIGALTKLGLSDDDAKYYDGVVEKGGVLLAVEADEADAEAVQRALDGAKGVQETAAAPAVAAAGTAAGVVRGEEELQIEKHERAVGRVRLVKRVEEHDVHVTVPVKKETVRVVREAADGTPMDSGAETQEIVLNEEVVDVSKRMVAKERVSLEKTEVTEQREVEETLRKERVDMETDADRQ